MRRAVIDVGSNAVLLTVGEKTADGWRFVFETSEVTALGESTKETLLLKPEAMARTLRAVKSGYEKARSMGAVEVTACATMAARIAKNTHEFLALAGRQRTPVTVLSGEEEAELGLRCVLDDPMFAGSDRISIIDVGGHSTEIVVACAAGVSPANPDSPPPAPSPRSREGVRILFRKSFPVGTLGLLGDGFGESLTSADLLKASAYIDDAFGFCCLPRQCGSVVALGAAPTNLISIREKLLQWDPEKVHGETLDYEEISKAVGWLCPMTNEERAVIPGMEPKREKTLHLGALILERALFALRGHECQVSVRGWRHALLMREDS